MRRLAPIPALLAGLGLPIEAPKHSGESVQWYVVAALAPLPCGAIALQVIWAREKRVEDAARARWRTS